MDIIKITRQPPFFWGGGVHVYFISAESGQFFMILLVACPNKQGSTQRFKLK